MSFRNPGLARILCIIAALALTSGLMADRVVLKNGDSYRGTIVSQDRHEVRIRTSFALVTLPKSGVVRLEFDEPADRWDSLWRSALLPGWGQFWHDRPIPGALYSGGTFAGVATSTLLYLSYLSARDAYNASQNDSSLFSKANTRRKQFNAALTITIGLWIWQAADAAIFAPTTTRTEGLSAFSLEGQPGLFYTARF